MENKKNTSPEWPIVPTFLSLRNKRDENSANYNADGIYYTDYIRGFLADLSHEKDIQNAMTIFQFVPYDFLPYDPNAENPEEIPKKFGKATVILNEPLDPKIKEIINRQKKKIIRIESGTFKNNGRLCDVFRKCNCDNISFCFKQDSIVGIFADEQLNAVVFTSEKYQQRLNALICEFNLSRNKINKIQCEEITVNKNKRFYIHYTCPYSLFEEHIFPIYVQGRIIACLMLGQMARDSFVKKESFSCYWKRMKEIDEKSHQYLSDICSLSSEDWKKKLTAIIKRLEIFEDRLEDRIEHRNSRYIKKAFADVERQFREDVKGINIKKQDAFWLTSKSLCLSVYH